MALSNWDEYIAVGTGFVSEGEFSCELYKNWLYVKKQNEVIATIRNGDLDIGPFDIRAIRGPLQSAIFVYVEPTRDIKPILAGVGCYGFGGPDGDEWVGVLPETKEEFQHWLESAKRHS